MAEENIQANIVTTPDEIMPFPVSAPQQSALTTVEQTRAIQEVQASLIIARRFPRDQLKAYNNIIKACQRKDLADAAFYAYPRYDARLGRETEITGPTIRLAEVLAQNWENVIFGIRELSRGDDFSEVETFAWDLETNTKTIRQFQVPHIRYRKAGSIILTDPRDIYEMISNYGSRRVRDCIFRIIPGDIKIAAERECQKTLLADAKENIEDKLRDIVVSFSEIGVSKKVIENKLGHPLEATIPDELVQLRKIYASIRDKVVPREKFFDLSDLPPNEAKPPPPPKPPRPRRSDWGTKRGKPAGNGQDQTTRGGVPTIKEPFFDGTGPPPQPKEPSPPTIHTPYIIEEEQIKETFNPDIAGRFICLGWTFDRCIEWLVSVGIHDHLNIDEGATKNLCRALNYEIEKEGLTFPHGLVL